MTLNPTSCLITWTHSRSGKNTSLRTKYSVPCFLIVRRPSGRQIIGPRPPLSFLCGLPETDAPATTTAPETMTIALIATAVQTVPERRRTLGKITPFTPVEKDVHPGPDVPWLCLMTLPNMVRAGPVGVSQQQWITIRLQGSRRIWSAIARLTSETGDVQLRFDQPGAVASRQARVRAMPVVYPGATLTPRFCGCLAVVRELTRRGA